MAWLSLEGCEDTELKSTCDINLLSKLSIIFKERRVMNNADRGGAYPWSVVLSDYNKF
jgi:hypothetical protein